MTDFSFLFFNVHFEFEVEIFGGYRNITYEHTYFFVEFFDTFKFDFLEMVARSTICGRSTRYVLEMKGRKENPDMNWSQTSPILTCSVLVSWQ